LDLMLPEVSGLDVCRTLRAETNVPIIMLTARTTEEDKLLGLDLGADDYVTKPFSPRELLARVRAVLRRAGEKDEEQPAEARVGELLVNFRRHQVKVGGRSVSATPTEFRLLETLIREPGRVFSRLELVARVYGPDYEGLERTVDEHVLNLRKKIESDPKKPNYILTVFGVGYKVNEEVHV
jgi:DNA-binding response OmpR family regulator